MRGVKTSQEAGIFPKRELIFLQIPSFQENLTLLLIHGGIVNIVKMVVITGGIAI
jgi:hypothetical protein